MVESDPRASDDESSRARRARMPESNVGDLPTIVLIANVAWDGRWMSRQYLADALGRRARVLFVEMPVSIASPLRSRERLSQLRNRFRRLDDTLAVVAPQGVPPQSASGIKTLNARWLTRQIKSALARLDWPEPDLVICNLRRSWRVRSAFPNSHFCAYLTDTAPTAEATGAVVPGAVGAGDAADIADLMRTADSAFAVSPPLVEAARDAGLETLYLPHGMDYATIATAAAGAPPADLERIPKPRLGFIGGLTYRIDFDLVRRVARARRDWNLVFVGDKRQEWLESQDLGIESEPNVYLLGNKPQSELGAYLAGFDVAWVPYAWNEFNRASFPLKAMEYLAAGRPVVANDFASLASLNMPIHLVAEQDDFLPALDAAFDAAGNAKAADARTRFAAANSWDARADTVIEFLETHRHAPSAQARSI